MSKRPEAQLQPFLTHNGNNVDGTTQERKETQKWRQSLYLFILLGLAVLCINTAFLVWALRTKGATNGVGILYEATCDYTKKVNIGVHLLINILSTAILGASNYCMQCLSAPTRSEVEDAHRKGNWLDVGIPSMGNIMSSSFGARKKVCWWILGLSSFPLHLCYNSVVFMSTSAQTYGVIEFGPETKAAIENGTFNGTMNTTSAGGYISNPYINGQLYAEAFKAGRLENLTLRECIDAYSATFQSARGNVFLVIDEGVMGPDEIYGAFNYIERTGTCSADTGTSWIYRQFEGEAGSCFQQQAGRFLPRLQEDPSMWAPFAGHRVRSCLSEATGPTCKLSFSVHLMLIVIAFNVVKIAAILTGLFTLRNDPMLTVGDAVASFLREPDTIAHNMCLVSQQDIHTARKAWPAQQQPRTFTMKSGRWSSAVKRGKRWTVRLALFTGISVLIFLFFYAYISIRGDNSLRSILGIGLGNVDPRTIVQDGTASSGLLGVFSNVFVANSPQVIISLIYFSYNAAITSMLLGDEWSAFFNRYKPLRVSTSRRGHQRSTYFLQLPYRYALPLLGFSTLLHWLASQSLFVVSVELYNMYGEHKDFISLSFSPLGILLSFVVAVVLAIGMFILGRKKLSPAPLVGSCSAAIAASCFARPYEVAPWEKELKWGAFMLHGDEQYFGMPHCGLSSIEVSQPISGQQYA
ncbi:hypothetical protein COCC4DRAFT_128640 [Bipolaris maydis ATCC 48331]|uniref:DUF6536 domain-containing protein n=2 Tax=Cochliobolus heterostrophus TaxID=5016 RepID=M2UTX7_COCH5|nr:uncharacterized protein COCC4DRAFT_128640 [Bipolaris maydis ATCC 48331]EMD91307.1 hypothetical protein COCHEDRAFT_1135691 [Bipolaris maydis C5]KAJ5027483.1 hypothetical protein J3E73DRAFT_210771 [Bipolaris maydis]ENI08936.1 hypothetical protein COCC4DRAFT_128640 [Bipolaris maydis ATCC 48331]KAJ6208711.1 hypothetical protein PSV09DRAFT_1135691 [Bipolaris maydis]KAJ6270617.1 hypothetical protein PSV08DRAFT_223114 [Bipolaris maydis]